MHILFVVSWYKDNIRSTVGSFFEEQARALRRHGHTVNICYPDFIPFNSKEKEYYHEFSDEGIFTFIHKVKGIIPGNRKINYWWVCKSLQKTFNNYCKRFGSPDILHAHAFRHAGNVALYIHRKTSIPFIITEHFSLLIDPNGINHVTDLTIAKRVYTEADAAVVVSSFFKKEIEKKLTINEGIFCIIPNLVNQIFFKGYKNITLERDSPVVFLHVANLVPIKNQLLLIDSFNYFVSNFCSLAQLNIIGNGALHSELSNYVDSLGLGSRISFLGNLSREGVVKQLQECHVFLLTSKIETFCVALAESHAIGRPVITTDCGGPSDFVTPNNGIIVKAEGAEEYANAMIYIVNNYTKYNQKAISQACSERFSEKVVINSILLEYRSLLDSKINEGNP